ncbi:MAG: phosphoribosylglycinamide formyltransferase [Thermoplasmata archaeon]|nr:phosphoribosylglycinamide formyltransferase [Thermoplasmata archaeon]
MDNVTQRKEVLKLAVFASGSGSDLQSIIDAVERGDLQIEISILVCNNPDAFALERARSHGIPSALIDHRGQSREEFEQEILSQLEKYHIDLIALAGFMRILTPEFVSRWSGRIVNIHPALLPSFPGVHAHRDAIAFGVKVSGLTIHFVDEGVDHGPIIFQKSVEVLEGDTEETLGERVLEQEHIWYPKVLQWIAEGRVHLDGRRVKVEGD